MFPSLFIKYKRNGKRKENKHSLNFEKISAINPVQIKDVFEITFISHLQNLKSNLRGNNSQYVDSRKTKALLHTKRWVGKISK